MLGWLLSRLASAEALSNELGTASQRWQVMPWALVNLCSNGQRGGKSMERLLKVLKPLAGKALTLGDKQARWPPRHTSKLGLVASCALGAGTDLESGLSSAPQPAC